MFEAILSEFCAHKKNSKIEFSFKQFSQQFKKFFEGLWINILKSLRRDENIFHETTIASIKYDVLTLYPH